MDRRSRQRHWIRGGQSPQRGTAGSVALPRRRVSSVEANRPAPTITGVTRSGQRLRPSRRPDRREGCRCPLLAGKCRFLGRQSAQPCGRRSRGSCEARQEQMGAAVAADLWSQPDKPGRELAAAQIEIQGGGVLPTPSSSLAPARSACHSAATVAAAAARALSASASRRMRSASLSCALVMTAARLSSSGAGSPAASAHRLAIRSATNPQRKAYLAQASRNCPSPRAHCATPSGAARVNAG